MAPALRTAPWPGPRPYEEHEEEVFFGREEILPSLLHQVTISRLTVLTAESGAGKTSLIAAGLMPLLRRQRAEQLDVPPALLLRHWGRQPDAPVEQRLVEAIRVAISDVHGRVVAGDWPPDPQVRERLVEDITLLGPVPPARTARAYVSALCDEADELLLVVDQAEELIGSATEGDAHRAEQVVRALGELFKQEPRLRLLISLRSEYTDRLVRTLNHYADNLSRRTFYLPPLPRPGVRDILVNGATRAGITVDGEAAAAVADRLAEWTGANVGQSVDLLKLQAVLADWHRWTVKKQQEFRLEVAALDRYRDERLDKAGPARSGDSENPGVRAASYALRAYVERKVDDAVGEALQELGCTEYAAKATARWMLARMLPRLSSPSGFKQHMKAADLLRAALEEDPVPRKLGLKPGERTLERYVQAVLTADGATPALDPAELTDAAELSGAARVLAGLPAQERAVDPGAAPAKVPPEDAARVVTALVRLGWSMLRRLDLLKHIAGNSTTCELVHDGFGREVIAWGEAEEKRDSEALGSPVALAGRDFRWHGLRKDVVGTVRGVSWRGCSLVGAALTDVEFVDCDLRGMIFLDCELTGCKFTRCDMAGVVMRGIGEIRPMGLDNVEFDAVNATSLALDTAIVQGVKFAAGTRLVNATLRDLTVAGRVTFEEAILRFAQIGGDEDEYHGDGKIGFLRCDLLNAYIRDFETTRVEVDRDSRTDGLRYGKLPREGAINRLEPQRGEPTRTW